MRKLNIVVLMGGRSSEREVSLASGKNIAQFLNPTEYNAIPVEITEEGKWLAWDLGYTKHSCVELEPTCLRANGCEIDVVFIALHGKFGEDGTVQGLFDMLGVPYTGSGVLASALAMNKLLSKKIFLQEKISTNKFIEVDYRCWSEQGAQREHILKEIVRELGMPAVVKPACEGSSVGINIAKDEKAMVKALDEAFVYGRDVLVEKYLKAREIQCGVLGNKDLRALPLIEIISENEFFDYEAKYTPELAKEIVPAPIGEEEAKRIEEISLRAYEAFGCCGFARIDTFLQEDGQVFVSEINTIPGMTANSLFPREAQAAGISFPQLLSTLVGLALERCRD